MSEIRILWVEEEERVAEVPAEPRALVVDEDRMYEVSREKRVLEVIV